MDDLVDRLRGWLAPNLQNHPHSDDVREAADEIERLSGQLEYFGKLHGEEHARLTDEIERLRAALGIALSYLDEDLAAISTKEIAALGEPTP